MRPPVALYLSRFFPAGKKQAQSLKNWLVAPIITREKNRQLPKSGAAFYFLQKGHNQNGCTFPHG